MGLVRFYMGFFPVTPDLLRTLTLSTPYMDVIAAFVGQRPTTVTVPSPS